MANKNVNILLKLEDRFTKPMVQAGKLTREQARAMNKCTSSVTKFSRTVRSGFTSAVGHVARFGAALMGIGGILSVAGIKSFCEEAIEGFNAATEAETKLEAVLGNVPSIIAQGEGAAAAAKTRLVAYADQLEEIGVVAGDVTTAGLQQLATFQLTEESLKQLMPGMANLIAQQKGINATQEDAIGYANLMGKAMSGQTGALTRAGIIMTDYQAQVMKTGNETQRAAMLAEILEQNVGGVNEALAQTDAGKIAQTRNLLGRAQDEIGGKLMSLKAEIYSFGAQYIPALQNAAMKLIDLVTPKIKAAMQWIADHTEDIKAGILRIKDGVVQAWQIVKPAVSWVIKHANVLIPTVLKVVAAVSGISIVADVATKIGSFVGAVKVAGTALKGLFAIIAANPVVAIIAGVVAAVIFLWKNCEGFRNFVKKAVEVIVAAWNRIKDTAVKVKDGAVAAFQKLATVVSTIFNTIKNAIGKVMDWIEDKIQKVKDAIDAIKQAWSDLTSGPWVDNSGGGASYDLRGHATGTPYFKGGLTRINEGGRGEIVDLPSGTRIIPHDVSEKSVGGNVYNFNFSIQGNVIGNRQYMEETARFITGRVKAALATV